MTECHLLRMETSSIRWENLGRGQESGLWHIRGVGWNFRLEQFFRSQFYSCLHLGIWYRVLQATKTGAETGGG